VLLKTIRNGNCRDGPRPAQQQANSLQKRQPATGANPQTHQGDVMFYWAAVFLVIALVAAVLGFGGIAGVSANIAWVMFIVGLVLAVVFFLRGRGSRP
jgi:uncharacterized membrane protein YtjA (UPF0391 family)